MIPADAGGTMTPYGKPRASGDDPTVPFGSIVYDL